MGVVESAGGGKVDNTKVQQGGIWKVILVLGEEGSLRVRLDCLQSRLVYD
jgi:hypothetical protein